MTPWEPKNTYEPIKQAFYKKNAFISNILKLKVGILKYHDVNLLTLKFKFHVQSFRFNSIFNFQFWILNFYAQFDFFHFQLSISNFPIQYSISISHTFFYISKISKFFQISRYFLNFQFFPKFPNSFKISKFFQFSPKLPIFF